ncbi:MAG: exodeoxyribonuclease I [Gammaproteobacteria bacterium CG11_big_fil_rev_8_21_14_0_20_46_22]|nr:MAG: exodeoxyribonuclease I [Gammaproteobacteria bacterium CG12_big_fil_rev_8_21_14_0_65_46_12]PIR11501.1 MAG: exodeoxyribonuclease I [Gammaproteobacteria bacterium CG11_big_fil_rev_8_21_14_0_20_46_22]
MKTYLFYDIETTGLNPAFDQVLQFAAIRTDETFNTLDEKEIVIRLRDDIVPAPGAVLTHQISPENMQEGLPEVEGIRAIHALMNEPGTVSLGYNTLGFDDEFLRFGFYRNLLTPYTHQFANQCARMDIFPITVLFYLFGECDLRWPMLDGRVSLKLENINAENNLASGQAHDAMVDVRATLALARRLKANTAMWAYASGYFNKLEDAKRMEQLSFAFSDTSFKEAILVDSKLGYGQHFQTFALCLGQHRHYRNQWCFLRLDREELAETTIDSLEKTTWCMKKKLAEAPFILPTKKRFMRHFSEDRLAIVENNQRFLQNNPEILEAITNHYLDYKYPLVPDADLDSILYQSDFLSRRDQNTALNFHEAKPELKQHFIEEFETAENRELALRIIGRNYPEALSERYADKYQQYLARCFYAKDYRGQDKLTPETALAALQSSEAENKSLINDLLSLYTRRAKF